MTKTGHFDPTFHEAELCLFLIIISCIYISKSQEFCQEYEKVEMNQNIWLIVEPEAKICLHVRN